MTGVLAAGVMIGLSPLTASAISTRDLLGPAGTQDFGRSVLVLGNGNYAVADPLFDGAMVNQGAVFVYNGGTNALISVLTGSHLNDHVGSGGLVAVGATNSNFVVSSPDWDNGAPVAPDAGAVTFVNGVTGLNAVVGAGNSLVGSTTLDGVGSPPSAFIPSAITVLSTGNYVVDTPLWNNGGTADVGAVTWGSGLTGAIGAVSSSNSLVGSVLDDQVGLDGVTALSDGSFVVASSLWNNGGIADAGAASWGNGNGTTTGAVGSGNSLVGTTTLDSVGADGVFALTGGTPGTYAVASSQWDNTAPVTVDVGAVTFGSAGGTVGNVTAVNSLLGTMADDLVGAPGSNSDPAVTVLTNGKYVVTSPNWDDGLTQDVGAATLIAAGAPHSITTLNSLVGTTAGDQVGDGGATALTTGNYVVISPLWSNGIGAATFGNGTTGAPFGAVNGNSLKGAIAGDLVGSDGVTALSNGNYVVASSAWDNGLTMDAGAVTWGNGTSGTTGTVGPANSLVGTTANDLVGGDGVTALSNGNYVVASASWNNGLATSAGAVTWANGAAATAASVSAANSLVGTRANDLVGIDGVTALSDGNYVVASDLWDLSASVTDSGAVTWGNGGTGTTGAVSAANSLVGSTSSDFVGFNEFGHSVIALAAGQFLVLSPSWDNGATADAGAATLSPALGLVGPITADTSVFGTPPGLILDSSKQFTTDQSFVIGTSQNRVLLLRGGAKSPTITAHAPVTADAAAGASSAVVNFTNPTGTQKGGGTPNVVCSPSSGSLFPVGVTTVNCTATDTGGFTATTSFTVTVNGTSDFTSLAPGRLADTRPGKTTVDGQFAGEGIRNAGTTLALTVAGRGGVAADASAVALNVTAVDSLGDGFVTVFPCGQTQPNASNLNFTTGSIIPNAVIAQIGAAGAVCIFVSQATHLVVDVGGFFPASTALVPMNPARVIDTRPGQTTIDGAQQGDGLRAAGSITTVQITDRAGVPADASAVVLNVTLTETGAPGFATVYPCGITAPNASNMNYGTGSTVANMVVSKIGINGTVCILTQSAAQVIADVNGYFPATTTYQPLDPARVFDTRPAGSTIDGQFQAAGLLAADTTSAVTVGNRGGVPAGAATVVLNVTVTEPTAAGFITVYPCGIARPLASNVNFTAGATVANAVIVKVGDNDQVCFYNSASTQLIADVNGYFPV